MGLCNRYCCVGRAGRRLPAHPLIEPIGGNSVAHNGNIDGRPSFSSIASDFLCFALARVLQQRSRKYGSLESKHSRVVEKLAFYTRLNQSSVRVNGIDKDIGIFGHDHRRQAQQRRFTGGEPLVAELHTANSRWLRTPSPGQVFSFRPQSPVPDFVRHLDPDKKAIARGFSPKVGE